MLRPFATAEDMMRALEAAKIIPPDNQALIGHLAEQFGQMQMDPGGLGYWIARGLWNYAVDIYGAVDQESNDATGNTLPHSTAYYKQLIAGYGESVVRAIVVDGSQETAIQYLNMVLGRLA